MQKVSSFTGLPQLQVYNDQLIDVTPKLLNLDFSKEHRYKVLNDTLKNDLCATDSSTRASLMSRQSVASHSSVQKFKLGGLRLSLDDVIFNVRITLQDFLIQGAP